MRTPLPKARGAASPAAALTVLVSFLGWTSTFANAQVLPFFTNTALTVGFESNAVRTFSRFVVRNQLRRDGEKISDPMDRNVLVFAEVFAVPVRIGSDTVVTGSVPILHKELNLTAPGSPRGSLSDRGLGDTTILLKHRFYVNNFQSGGFQAAVIGGVKLPTGDNDERDDQGQLLPPSLQLGTGSVDVPIGVVMTAFRNRIGINADVLYKFNSKSDDFVFGDEMKLNLAVGYRLFPREYTSFENKVLNAYMEVNTVISQRASCDGLVVANSGGSMVFISPGLQWVLHPRFLIETAVQIPAVQELNGTQLAFGSTVNFGVRLLF